MQLQHRVRDGTGNALDLSGLGIDILSCFSVLLTSFSSRFSIFPPLAA